MDLSSALRKYPKLLDSKVTWDQLQMMTVGVELSFEHSEDIKRIWELGALTIDSVDFDACITTLKGTNLEVKKSYDVLVHNNFLESNKDNFTAFKMAAEGLDFAAIARNLASILQPNDPVLHNE
ncbi:MAG: hypothetical protein J0651_05245, partial [Actinobacteria bacterium]|nr:hypothetical protein [Actinomycetota bacterium]